MLMFKRLSIYSSHKRSVKGKKILLKEERRYVCRTYEDENRKMRMGKHRPDDAS